MKLPEIVQVTKSQARGEPRAGKAVVGERSYAAWRNATIPFETIVASERGPGEVRASSLLVEEQHQSEVFVGIAGRLPVGK